MAKYAKLYEKLGIEPVALTRTDHYCPQNETAFETDNETGKVVGTPRYDLTPYVWWHELTYTPTYHNPYSVCDTWNGTVTCTHYPGGWN